MEITGTWTAVARGVDVSGTEVGIEVAATCGAQAVNKRIVNSRRYLLFIRIRFDNIIFPFDML
jgi:hypothetical protein